MTYEQQEEDRSRAQQMMDAALPAEGDTELMLLQLSEIAAKRRPDPELEARYEGLRDALVKRLREEGPRYFIDAEGNKRYAWPTLPEKFEGDASKAIELYENGEIPLELLDEIAPRKVDPAAIQRAARRAHSARPKKPPLKPEHLIQIMRRKPSTGYVKFGSLEQSDEL